MSEVTTKPDQEADIQERIDALNKELPVLLGKYELALAAVAGFTPDGRVEARPIVVSARGRKVEPNVAPAKTALDEG